MRQNRTKENLARSDKALFTVRRLLMQGARTVQQSGDPPGLKPSSYRIRPVIKMLAGDTRWQEAVKDALSVPNA